MMDNKDDILNWDVIKTENDFMDALAARACIKLGRNKVYEEIESSNMSEKDKTLTRKYIDNIQKYIKKT